MVLDATTLAQEVSQHFDPSVYVSLALLFGIAAQFKRMDGNATLTRIIASLEGRVGILYAVVVVTTAFSPLILNDVVVLILTPVLAAYCRELDVGVAPLLVAEVAFTNIASSLTPFGNPQNILLWQTTGISASRFVLGTSLPLAISAVAVATILYPMARGLRRRTLPSAAPGSISPAIYLLAVAAVVFASDLLRVPDVVALGLAFLIGFPFTFRSLRGLPEEFDLRSLIVLYSFVASVTVASVFLGPVVGPYAAEAASGVQPFSALFVGAVSCLISNVPATQLILSLAHVPAGVAPKMAVEAGLAGNIDPIASFANILALLLARRAGLPLTRAIVLQFGVGLVSFLPALL